MHPPARGPGDCCRQPDGAQQRAIHQRTHACGRVWGERPWLAGRAGVSPGSAGSRLAGAAAPSRTSPAVQQAPLCGTAHTAAHLPRRCGRPPPVPLVSAAACRSGWQGPCPPRRPPPAWPPSGCAPCSCAARAPPTRPARAGATCKGVAEVGGAEGRLCWVAAERLGAPQEAWLLRLLAAPVELRPPIHAGMQPPLAHLARISSASVSGGGSPFTRLRGRAEKRRAARQRPEQLHRSQRTHGCQGNPARAALHRRGQSARQAQQRSTAEYRSGATAAVQSSTAVQAAAAGPTARTPCGAAPAGRPAAPAAAAPRPAPASSWIAPGPVLLGAGAMWASSGGCSSSKPQQPRRRQQRNQCRNASGHLILSLARGKRLAAGLRLRLPCAAPCESCSWWWTGEEQLSNSCHILRPAAWACGQDNCPDCEQPLPGATAAPGAPAPPCCRAAAPSAAPSGAGGSSGSFPSFTSFFLCRWRSASCGLGKDVKRALSCC